MIFSKKSVTVLLLAALTLSLVGSANQAFAEKPLSPPILGKVLGGGSIQLSDHRGIFNIAIFQTSGGWRGHFNYKIMGKGSHTMFFSDEITSAEINADNATILGTACLMDYGLIPGYEYNLTAKDGGGKPGKDWLSVNITGPDSFKYEASGTVKGQIIVVNELEIPSYNVRGGKIAVRSNSTLENSLFYPDHGMLNLTVSGVHGTHGYINVTLRNEAIDGEPVVAIDGIVVPAFVKSNATHHEIYLEYEHSTHEISIYGTGTTPIPEFGIGSMIVLSLSMIIAYHVLKRQTFAGQKSSVRKNFLST